MSLLQTMPTLEFIESSSPSKAQIEAFAASLHGDLIQPDDVRYDKARAVWNGMINRHPALVARCANVDDVVSSVLFARQYNLTVAVRGGGHNVAGHGTCYGGLVIDMSPMNEVVVDPQARIARAGGGATIDHLD